MSEILLQTIIEKLGAMESLLKQDKKNKDEEVFQRILEEIKKVSILSSTNFPRRSGTGRQEDHFWPLTACVVPGRTGIDVGGRVSRGRARRVSPRRQSGSGTPRLRHPARHPHRSPTW